MISELSRLLPWYDANQRDLPWRASKDPYAIWVSEMMLQQTQVATVLPYWRRWMERFPTVAALAEADEQAALSMWQGLGYYRRCRFLQAGARYVLEHGLPNSAEEWRRVPGVGRYTAAAIASISQGHPAALVDGNVERVYARFAGDASSGVSLTNSAWKWAEENLDRGRPGDWNQALMELGATVCRPIAPNCAECPLNKHCVAHRTGRTATLPTVVPRRATKELSQIVWVPLYQDRFGVRQISEGAWWEGMWEFPRTEESPEAVTELRAIVGSGEIEPIGIHRHTVTHHRIAIRFSLVRCHVKSDALTWFTPEELADLPMPAPQRKILESVRSAHPPDRLDL